MSYGDVIRGPTDVEVLVGRDASFSCDMEGDLDERFEMFQFRRVCIIFILIRIPPSPRSQPNRLTFISGHPLYIVWLTRSSRIFFSSDGAKKKNSPLVNVGGKNSNKQEFSEFIRAALHQKSFLVPPSVISDMAFKHSDWLETNYCMRIQNHLFTLVLREPL